MTACVKNHSRRVALAISASLVGALSLGAAPVAAVAEESVTTQDATSQWEGVDLSWSGTYDDVNGYWTVPAGDAFTLNTATAADGTVVPLSDLTVVYVSGVGSTINWTNSDQQAAVSKTAPTNVSDYHAIVINGKPWIFNGMTTLKDLKGWFDNGQVKDVYVKVVKKSVAGAYAIEGDDVSDTTFKYTGDPKDVQFALGGVKLEEGKDYQIQSIVTAGQFTATDAENAGDYVYTIKGIGNYEGSTTVTVKVDPIDFEHDTFTVDTVATNSALIIRGMLSNTKIIKVNGQPLNDPCIIAGVAAAWNEDGTAYADPGEYDSSVRAKIDLRIDVDSTKDGYVSTNYVGHGGHAQFDVVGKLIDNFYYDNKPLTLDSDRVAELTIDASKGESFDPKLITAAEQDGDRSLPCTVTVARDGEESEDYSTPGTLVATVKVTAPQSLAYGGTATVKVQIIGKHYSAEPQAFVSIDGKDVASPSFGGVEYDGEAVVPSITVKSGSAVVDPADYTVTYTDEDGNEVEGDIVEPGKYTGTISFGGATYGINGENEDVQNIEFSFEVTKATLHSAKADKDVYAYTGDTVTPMFTAYTGENCDGLSLEIDPVKVGVSYYKAKWDVVDLGNWLNPTDDVYGWVKDVSKPVTASQLKDEGHYVAVLTAPADDPHFSNQRSVEAAFEISDYAGFEDVDASAWYAQDVYNAKDLGYMTGIAGTKLFMPEANISRGEIAKVFFNMAGMSDGEYYSSGSYVPTKFADVDARAWYAEPVAWASNAGIVTGYLGTEDFGPNDQATREQVAAMIYRYAAAQGKDTAVQDADAALAAYTDGAEVSDWAKTAMAWCVENGVFGVDTDELKPQDNIQRAQVASIAVRVQPEALK